MKRIFALVLASGLAACSAEHSSSSDDSAQAATVAVDPYRELMIVHPSVVADPLRTSNAGDGHWSFRWLMERLSADSNMSPGEFVEAWLAQFRLTQVPGTSAPLRDRPGVDALIAKWPKDRAGHVDLAHSPFRLMAIVNRIDKGTSLGDMGEGRFVFSLVDQDTMAAHHPDLQAADPMSMTVIFEFHLPGQPKTAPKDNQQRQKNAQKWHALGGMPFGESYNHALQGLTDAFVSTYGTKSLNQLRTNVIALATSSLLKGQPGPEAESVWELREFKLVGGKLVVSPVQATAGDAYIGDPTFGQYLLDNKADLLAGKLALGTFAGFTASQEFSKTRWQFPDVGGQPFPDDVRFAFAKGTCNGCHNAEQASFAAPQFPEGQSIGFLHITPFVGADHSPGGDLSGTERVSGFLKVKDLPRRATFMQNVLANPASTQGTTPY